VEQNEIKRQSVLVVEDEPYIAMVCMRTLTAEGFEVDIAVNGEVALGAWVTTQ
jgi:DNA-binding response OmpR family regulator